jgi:hypothetical protein
MAYVGNPGSNKIITTDAGGRLLPGTVGSGLSITDGNIDTFLPINPQSSDYTLSLGDKGTMVIITSGSLATLTVPTNSSVPFSIGTQILVVRGGSGEMEVSGSSGVLINSSQGYLNLNHQNSAATLVKSDTDTWYLFGDLKE